MASIRKELEEKLEKILRVYVFAQETYLYTEYFHNPKTQDELDFVTKSAHSSEVSVIMHMMFRTMINEIHKLFSNSDNDKFRLDAFVNSLSQSGHFRNLGVSQDHVTYWQHQLTVNQTTIDNVLTLRSKLYAHTDDPMEDYNSIDISFKQIKKLLDLAASIITGIYKDIFGTGLLLDSPTFDKNRFKLLELMVNGEKQRLAEIYSKYRNFGSQFK